MGLKDIKDKIIVTARDKVIKTVVDPINQLVDQNITDVSTTIGNFIVRSVRGKFQRSITFQVGVNYYDKWMEEALYGILYKYNNIKKASRLEITNKKGMNDGSGMYYQLDDGAHNLKYRNYNILLAIQTSTPQSMNRVTPIRTYTVITYDLNPEFVTLFEKDMLRHRNALLDIKADSPTITVYQDYHESDGWTYWEKMLSVPKRKLSTIYLPSETKLKIVNTINEFFANKKYYRDHGIAHNLKILLYGPPGPQPVSIKIPTPDGMKRFGDLRIGDKVFDRKGHPTTITEIHQKGVQDVYEVKFLNGRTTRCTIDHLWKVFYRSHGKWKEDVVPLAHIINNSNIIKAMNDTILITGEKRYSVPTNRAAEFNERYLHLDPYVMGIIITNGCLTDEYFRISQPTDEVPLSIAKTLNLEVERRSEVDNDYSYIFYDHDRRRVKTKDILGPYGILYNIKSPDRFIPDDFLYNSIENRLALLNGLLDGDGSIIERTDREWISPIIRFTTTSEKLAEQFMWLCRSLGIDCLSQPDYREKYTSGYCTNISIQIDPNEMYKLFRVSYKVDTSIRVMNHYRDLKDKLKWKKYHDKSKIVSVRKLPEQEEVMCIKVDNPEHLYLTEDFVVTHNTGKDSIAKMVASEWNRNIYYITGGKDGRYIPNAITDDSETVNHPLLLISDIDKYPYLINEPEVNMDKENTKDENMMRYKQLFGSMINSLDGILSAEDRIIIMTTNHIEKFSEVLIRPGRVDLKIEIGYVTPEVFRKYTYDFYKKELPKDIQLKDDKLTVAMLQEDIMFMKLTADEFISKYVK